METPLEAGGDLGLPIWPFSEKLFTDISGNKLISMAVWT